MIEAILVPRRLDAVRELLLQRGCQEVIVSEVLSEGGPKLNYRGLTYKGEAYRVKVQTIVADSGRCPPLKPFFTGKPKGLQGTNESWFNRWMM